MKSEEFVYLLILWFVVLSLGFLSSIFVGIGWLGEEYRIVAVLENNPARATTMVMNVFLYGVLPKIAGAIICIIAYLRWRKSASGSFGNWLMAVVSGIYASFGAYYLQGVYGDYQHAITEANRLNISYLNDSLRTLFTFYGLDSVLVILIGALWVVTFLFSRQHKKLQ